MAYNKVKVKARQVVSQTNTQNQDLGVVSEVPMDLWSATVQYQKLNKVRYMQKTGGGVTLLAKKANQGIEPFVSNGWQEVWMVENYDGLVSPVGTYPEMTVGNAVKAENDGSGTNIANQFSQVASDIQGLREDITNESHFRGMFESVAALQAAYPTATPNDYAYIVGGNQWIYQNGDWTDSGVPSPNTSVPASDAIPLMDGAGASGISGQYARGDHRHPSDTNKVSKSGDTMDGPLVCKQINDFITLNNEFDFGDPNGTLYIQYRNANVTEYKFCNGDGTGGLANIVGKELYEDSSRVFSPNNMPTGVKDYNSPEHTVRLSGSKKNTWANTTYVPVFDGTGYDICYANKPTAEDIGAVPDNGTAKGQVPVSTLTTGGDATWVFPMAEVTSASTAVAGHLFTSYNLLNGNNCVIQTKIKNNYKLAIQWGQVDSSGSSATFASVTFPRAFWNTPKVFATYHATNTGSIADSYGWVRRDSVSTTGCTIRSYGGNSVVWIAIGVVSGD